MVLWKDSKQVMQAAADFADTSACFVVFLLCGKLSLQFLMRRAAPRGRCFSDASHLRPIAADRSLEQQQRVGYFGTATRI